MKRHAFLSASLVVAALLCGVACSDRVLTVQDLGFEPRVRTVWSPDHLAWTAVVTLASGQEGGFTLRYAFDGQAGPVLSTLHGTPLESGSEVSLAPDSTLVLLLPRLDPAESHTLSMELTREGIVRTLAVPLPDTGSGSVAVDVDASAGRERTLVTLTPRADTPPGVCTVILTLDGETVDGIGYLAGTLSGPVEVDFSDGAAALFTLPPLVSGDHLLGVTLQAAGGSESHTVAFTEPMRRSVPLEFGYNPFSGTLTLRSDHNPLGTAFSVTADVTVRGTLTWRHPQLLGTARAQTLSTVRTGEASVRLTPGPGAEAVDGGLLRRLLDEVHAVSAEDASNLIGNANARTLHSDITAVTVRLTVRSEGPQAGRTAVAVSPPSADGLRISYTYSGDTWTSAKGHTLVLRAALSVNGSAPGDVGRL